MTHVKTKTQRRVSDAEWLEQLFRRAEVPVRPPEALIPAAASSAASTMGGRALPLTSPELRARAERIVRHGQAHKLDVFPVAVAPLFAGWRLYPRGARYDYVFCNVAEDPLFHDPDRFPIPQATLAQLERLHTTGLGREFDLLYVVHEVEKGSVREGEPLDPDKLVPPSPRVRRSSERMGRVSLGLWLGAAAPLLAGVGAAVASPAIAFAAPLALDPLLLGAVVAPGRAVREGEMAVWFYLAQWSYE